MRRPERTASTDSLTGEVVNATVDFLTLQLYADWVKESDYLALGISKSKLAFGATFETFEGRQQTLESYLQDYLDTAGIAGNRDGAVFRTAVGRTGILSERRMTQSDAWSMLQRRARNAGIPTAVCNHTFCATGITVYLDNDGSLENAQIMAAHESPAPPNFMIGPMNRLRSMRSKKSEFRPLLRSF